MESWSKSQSWLVLVVFKIGCTVDSRLQAKVCSSGKLWLRSSRAVPAQQWKHSAEPACFNLTAVPSKRGNEFLPICKERSPSLLGKCHFSMHLKAQNLKQNECNQPFTFPGFLLFRSANKTGYIRYSYKWKRLQEAATDSSGGDASPSCRIYRPGSSFVTSPVWCSPSHLSLHRSAGAARLGCLSFPTGTGPRGHGRSAGQTRWETGTGRCRGPEELRGAGRCRVPRRGQSREGSSAPLNPHWWTFTFEPVSGTRAAPARGPGRVPGGSGRAGQQREQQPQ